MEDKNMQLLTEQFLILERQVAKLRASLLVLKGIVAMDLNPSDPIEAVKQIQALEDRMLNADPNNAARQQTAEILEAVKLWKMKGGGQA
jgi:hypothetical protein